MNGHAIIVIIYYLMIFGAVGWSFVGQPVAASVMAAAAGIVIVINTIAIDYFKIEK